MNRTARYAPAIESIFQAVTVQQEPLATLSIRLALNAILGLKKNF
jgi:hypothetical protein